MATATKKMPKANPEKARSPLVAAILTYLASKRKGSWTTRAELVEAVGNHVSKDDALKVYEYRVGKGKERGETQKDKIARGRLVQVMLVCITLVQHEKIEQDGRGSEKKYRLAFVDAVS